jgi:hypothetical protein
MKAEPRLRPDDSVEEFYEDPIFNENNKYLEKKFDILTNVLTVEESTSLETFITSKISTNAPDSNSNTSQKYVLQYRPDEWDSAGAIQKVYDIARKHILDTYAVIGQLEPRSFTLLRTEDAQTYKEEYGAYNQNGEILYTAIVTASNPPDYYSGETLYLVNGEGFMPNRYDIVVHRNESHNNWEIVDVVTGVRLDLLVVFREHARRTAYNYYIDQLDEDSLNF